MQNSSRLNFSSACLVFTILALLFSNALIKLEFGDKVDYYFIAYPGAFIFYCIAHAIVLSFLLKVPFYLTINLIKMANMIPILCYIISWMLWGFLISLMLDDVSLALLDKGQSISNPTNLGLIYKHAKSISGYVYISYIFAALLTGIVNYKLDLQLNEKLVK